MRTFLVHARRTPEILGRVVSLFHRHEIEVERLTFEPGDQPKVARMTIEVLADAE